MAQQTFTSGQTLTAAQMTTLQSNSGLQLVQAETAFSAVSAVNLAANTFNATYRNYKIIFQLDTASTTLTISCRLRAAGSDNTSSTYNQMSLGLTQTNVASNKAENNQSAFTIQQTFTDGFYALSLDILDPITASTTMIQGALTCDDAATFVGRNINGIFSGTTSFDSFSFIASTGTMTGTTTVYGYTKS